MIPVDAIPPLTRTTLREQAYRLIRQMIIAGRLAPGASLSERAIGDQLGVSRAPIKDALLRLEREGFVVSRSDGRYVKELDRQAILQMYEVRERLEVLAAQLAAAAITPPKAAFLAEGWPSTAPRVRRRTWRRSPPPTSPSTRPSGSRPRTPTCSTP